MCLVELTPAHTGQAFLKRMPLMGHITDPKNCRKFAIACRAATDRYPSLSIHAKLMRSASSSMAQERSGPTPQATSESLALESKAAPTAILLIPKCPAFSAFFAKLLAEKPHQHGYFGVFFALKCS